MKTLFPAVGALLLACSSALAQSDGTPEPGLWEVTTAMIAGPRSMSPPADRRCLTAQAAAGFEQFFVTPPPSAKPDEPKCQLSDVQRGGTNSVWRAECEGPRGKLNGIGESTFTEVGFTAKQTFRMGIMRMEMTTQARHLGPC